MSSTPESTQLPQCPEHGLTVKWICNQCGKPICSDCKPVAFNYQVFHPNCLDVVNRKTEKKSNKKNSGTPSPGVKAVAWFLLIMAVVLFGAALLLIGVAVFSRHYVPMLTWMSGSISTLDDIPGGRIFLGWMGFIAMAASVIHVFVGVGLLNCLQAARRTLLVVCWIEILLAGFGWMIVLMAGGGFWDVPAVAVFFVIYFSRPKVRRQFEHVSELIEVHR
jgi:hypothetical protein